MNGNATTGTDLWVERIVVDEGIDLWVVSGGGRHLARTAPVQAWLMRARAMFAERVEIASISMVAPSALRLLSRTGTDAGALQAPCAALPFSVVSGRVADLLGLGRAHHETSCPVVAFQRWIEAATLRGLVHAWLADDAANGWTPVMTPGLPDARSRFVPAGTDAAMPDGPGAISIGIDAAWLLGGESGAQVFVFEMLKELSRRPQVARIVLLSDPGGRPRALDAVEKIESVSWTAALARGAPLVDILHRPYQPGWDVDYRRYHQVAGCVALTVLDFIAYDNPSYHESTWHWRRYQDAFDENVCLADCVFAISQHVGSRLERQFAHRLSGPVRAVPLGTDHLCVAAAAGPGDAGPGVRALDGSRYLLVLGNDFAHKNRDFATRVFADMRDRGYVGRLVLAGFHLDNGSSFGYELDGAGRHAADVVRIGAVSVSEKAWLMANADAVLYPTSSEGFGLIPFEAAAFDTPTAFVTFGPLREALSGVDACGAWEVRPFADHVFALLADPARQVAQIRSAGTALTWSAHVDQVLGAYRMLVSDAAPWRARARSLPDSRVRLRRAVHGFGHRVVSRIRRMAGRT